MTGRIRGVIVDGPDCAGKTTLVKKLKTSLAGLGWDVLQMAHKEGDQFRRYMEVYLAADRLVLDRGHFSEVVYGDLLRGGRHFAPWERELLDQTADAEFVTVLCTAPPDLLRTRQMARDYARMGAAFENTLREHIEDRSLARAQEKFEEIVAPRAHVVCRAFVDRDLDEAVEAIRTRLGLGAGTPEAHTTPANLSARYVVVEGAAVAEVERFARMLVAQLKGWKLSTFDHVVSPNLFERLVSTYLASAEVVFIGSHIGKFVSGSNGHSHMQPAHRACLSQCVAARAVVVLCARADADHDTHRRRLALDQDAIPYVSVDPNDPESVRDIVSLVRSRVVSLPV